MSTAKSGSRIAKPATPPIHSVRSSIQRFDVTAVTTGFPRSTHSLWRRTARAIFGSVVTQNFSRGGSDHLKSGSGRLKSTAPGHCNPVRARAVAADGSLWVGMQLAGQGGLQHIVDGALKSFVTPKLNGETLGVNALL